MHHRRQRQKLHFCRDGECSCRQQQRLATATAIAITTAAAAAVSRNAIWQSCCCFCSQHPTTPVAAADWDAFGIDDNGTVATATARANQWLEDVGIQQRHAKRQPLPHQIGAEPNCSTPNCGSLFLELILVCFVACGTFVADSHQQSCSSLTSFVCLSKPLWNVFEDWLWDWIRRQIVGSET